MYFAFFHFQNFDSSCQILFFNEFFFFFVDFDDLWNVRSRPSAIVYSLHVYILSIPNASHMRMLSEKKYSRLVLT